MIRRWLRHRRWKRQWAAMTPTERDAELRRISTEHLDAMRQMHAYGGR